jgi:hypothetical protein
LVGVIGALVIGGAAFAILDYETFEATGAHFHFDLPTITMTGTSFLKLGTPMIAVAIAGVLLLVGIMVLAVSISSKTGSGWTRPERLDSNSYPEQTENDTDITLTESQQQTPSPSQPPRLVVCRYCYREIPHGRYCADCHLSTGQPA